MKKIILSILLTSCAFAGQKKKVYSINCEFSDIEDRGVMAEVYDVGDKHLIADVRVVTNYTSNKPRVLEEYKMIDIIEEFSFYVRLEDPVKKVYLNAMLDDMGRISSWKKNNKSYDLTCSVWEE